MRYLNCKGNFFNPEMKIEHQKSGTGNLTKENGYLFLNLNPGNRPGFIVF